MNQQVNETIDYLMSNENDEQDFFQLADLTLTDEQLAEIKGGACVNCTWGPPVLNHNETAIEDEEETETESLADLLVENDEQVKGGPGGYNCSVCGIGLGNHNETMNAEADE